MGQQDPGSELLSLTSPPAASVAYLAFILSIFNTGYQVWQWMSVSNPVMLPVEQVLLIPDAYPSGATYLRIAARTSYTNSGPAQKSSVVVREWVEYSFDRVRRAQQWQSHDEFEGRGCNMRSVISKDVHPFVVQGQEAISHVTYYAPRSRKKSENKYVDYHSWEGFLDDLAVRDEAFLYFNALLLDGKRLSSTCKILIDADIHRYLKGGCPVTVSCA